MASIINASTSNGIVQTADGSGILKCQANGVTTNALAWVNFDGTTSPGTIRAQYNVGSVTKVATGRYAINFTTTLFDANWVAAGLSKRGSSPDAQFVTSLDGNSSQTSSVCYICTGLGSNGTYTDSPFVEIAIFGN